MNQPQQLSISCNFQGFLGCKIPKDVIKVELKLRPSGENLLSILTSIQGQRSTGPGRRSAATGSIPEGDNPAMKEQASLT